MSRVSQQRVRRSARAPVLGSLIALSEGKQLAAQEVDQLRREWPAFAARVKLGYVVVDALRASDQLISLTGTLPIDLIAHDGALTLFRARGQDTGRAVNDAGGTRVDPPARAAGSPEP